MPPLEISTHASLLARLKLTGDQSAWAEFDDRYRELIFRLARRSGLQAADADDVTQDVLSAAHGALATFSYDPARGRFRGWLQTATSRAIGKKHRPGADLLGRPGRESLHENTPAACEEEIFESEWRQYHLRLALTKVQIEFNAKDLAAFEACALEGQAATEVATKLGCSVDSVHQAKSRIRKRVKEHVATQVAEEG